ncbi:uncharacterized protein PODANS_1_10150, partial [Podospora anserina S mat+]
LVGGSVSVPGSSFRAFFEDRVAQLVDLANFGSFGKVTCLLREIWLQSEVISRASSPGSNNEEVQQQQPPAYIHWRDVMQMKGWDYLLI